MNLLKCLLFFTGLLIISRLIPHPPNFTPLIAGAIFLPFMLNDKRLVIGIPLCVLFFSDLIIGIHNNIFWTYGAFILIGFTVLKYSKLKLNNLLSLSLVSPTIFYLVTNFGVWLTSSVYLKNISGLMECYFLAIPFFGNSLISTVLFALLFYLGRQLVFKMGSISST